MAAARPVLKIELRRAGALVAELLPFKFPAPRNPHQRHWRGSIDNKPLELSTIGAIEAYAAKVKLQVVKRFAL